MPFRLCNAPNTFQRLMEMTPAGLHWTTCLVYLDDIVVFSHTVEEYLSRLSNVFLRLRKAGLKVTPRKCQLSGQVSVPRACGFIPRSGGRSRKNDGYGLSSMKRHLYLAQESTYITSYSCLPTVQPPIYTCVDSDISSEGLGAILSQEIDRVVSFASHTLTRTEKKYCATRQELLSLVWGTQQLYMTLPIIMADGF